MKKRSQKRSSTSEPRSLTFFVDANLCGKSFYLPLREAGIALELHDDHFAEGTPDDEWLGPVGREGWIVLSRDKEIRRDSYNTERLMQSRVQAFMLIGKPPKIITPGEKSTFYPELAANFLRTFHKVCHFLERHPYPFIAKLARPEETRFPRPGRVEMWLTLEEWQQGRRGRS